MTISPEQLRVALGELNGQRNVRIEFQNAETCTISNALLVPVEADNLIKLTDGSHEYLIDAERVGWMDIG